MIPKLLASLAQAPKGWITGSALALVFLVGVTDFATGLDLQLMFFYLLPIALASWFVGRRVGILIALLCTLTWFLSNQLAGMKYGSDFIAAWNVVMRAAVSILIAYTLAELRAKLDRVSELASRDFLTGLPNGWAFYELAGRELERAFGLESLTLACIDIEGFEWINHRFGYAVGDQMLCTIAHAIRQSVPRPELVGRLGGTSFAVLLPCAGPEGARSVLENIQDKLKEERKKYAQPVTFFISAVACSKAPRNIAELMQEAETKMTRIKNSRRDALEIDPVDSVPALN